MNFLNQKTPESTGVYIHVNGDVEFMGKYNDPSNRQVGDVWFYFDRDTEPYITYLTIRGHHSWREIPFNKLSPEIQAFFALIL